jgi:DNA-binding transcriptional ArsR family regulator
VPDVLDVEVIADPAVATTALDPVRSRILAELASPGSATTVAAALGQPRQKINYHLRTLEEHGLVHLVEERPRRGLTERVLMASARSYVLSPEVLGRNAADPTATDRYSTGYVIALASRVVREVAALARGAAKARQPLATLAIDTDIRFASAADRAAFTAEVSETITSMVARYHDEHAPHGRWHRLVLVAHPRPPAPKGSQQER